MISWVTVATCSGWKISCDMLTKKWTKMMIDVDLVKIRFAPWPQELLGFGESTPASSQTRMCPPSHVNFRIPQNVSTKLVCLFVSLTLQTRLRPCKLQIQISLFSKG